ncbi:alpha/beta fold hydrolase [Candidatus Woesearchaeota archaeon]|nr:alpha/beta fold hydrolase [Candidatus Woesearchaeota archaeon]
MQKISFKNNFGLTLRGTIFKPKKYTTAIIFCHGFPSSAEGSSPKRFAKFFQQMGYLVMLFSFSGSGSSEGKFEDKLMSQEVKDIKSAVDFLSEHYEYNQLVLIGHSTGAIDAALYAHTDKRVDKLVLLGGVSKLSEAVRYDFTDEQVRDFWKKGYIVYHRAKSWVHKKKIKRAFYDEFFQLDVLGSLKKFKKPLLIIHGEKDEAIPVQKDPQELYAAANQPKKLLIIKNADHRFSKLQWGVQVAWQIRKFVGK